MSSPLQPHSAALPRYDWSQSYEWNYERAPDPIECTAPPMAGEWHFCGMPVNSPLGIPAGPLLNGRWCLYYASLGFDVLTYKTVRSTARACYPLPNLQPVTCRMLHGGERELPAQTAMEGSWAVSFGMPSRSPDVWRQDVEATRSRLPADKKLVVSVVGTVQPGWTIDRLADDYAQCAAWAAESGADAVEANFSCPNVSTCDGQLYQVPEDARCVAERLRAQLGSLPLLIKIGHVNSPEKAARLLEALQPSVDALVMTNSIPATVRSPRGDLLFDGQTRGICGVATRDASVAQIAMFHHLLQERKTGLHLVGVGGVSDADDVRRYLAAGAHAVHLATAAMVHPDSALAIRRAW